VREAANEVLGALTLGRVHRARIAEQWRKETSLRSAFHARINQSVLDHSSVQERSNEFEKPLVFHSFCDPAHQFVVIDSIEEFLQVTIDAPAVTSGDILLRLGYRLMSGWPRSKTVAAFREGPIPVLLQNLHHRLLDESIQHRLNTTLSYPTVRHGNFYRRTGLSS